MGYLGQMVLFAVMVTGALCQSKGNDSGENRPYEFGFTIDGEQHRYEKKDEKGIIMGEFGFITADGYYRVTVYATDENGDFKILKMKNIKVGFPPGKPTTTTAKPVTKQQQKLNGFQGCGGCLIPESSSSSPNVPGSKFPGISPSVSTEISGDVHTKLDPRVQSTPNPVISPNYNIVTQDKSKSTPGNKYENGYRNLNEQKSDLGVNKNYEIGVNQKLDDQKYNTESNLGGNYLGAQNSRTTPTGGEAYTKAIDPSKGPQLSTVEMKILDYMARLYKFNYTLSFHGHEETGDVGGNKNGSYFSNGRDGYQRKVLYVANEFGYQPKISLVKLDADSTPKKETEKELTKLKGSEFIWFYKKK